MNEPLPPIRNDAPTPRNGRDWPQARAELPPLPRIMNPFAWIELYAAVASNCVQAAEIWLAGVRR